MANQDIKIVNQSSERERRLRESFKVLFNQCPIPEKEMLANLGLFLNRQALSRILFMHKLYKRILHVPGIVVEFGVRWGQNLALFNNFRGIYEPYNYTRKVVGFDTFEGFPVTTPEDGNADAISVGAYSVVANYEDFLEKVLAYHEQESPLPHLLKHELVRGDASVTVERYLKDNPETIIALAYFDFDIFEPTAKCLEAIRGHLVKGSVIGFDELNCHYFPGETLALKKIFGLDKYRLIRSPENPFPSFLVIE